MFYISRGLSCILPLCLDLCRLYKFFLEFRATRRWLPRTHEIWAYMHGLPKRHCLSGCVGLVALSLDQDYAPSCTVSNLGCSFLASNWTYSWKLPAFSGAFFTYSCVWELFAYSWGFLTSSCSFFAYSCSFLAYNGQSLLIRTVSKEAQL